ncbi:hypothetical protein DPMN_145728 [Dreissena polymorpha]|uniref:Uncharacterized protein n=1 Tax=Dreissena polymorpha TaxID=45954 RepID=A0A9D4F5R1_DREPO|nr:hypothetical protein DPMN_145728 [Dreissena polymorpha]
MQETSVPTGDPEHTTEKLTMFCEDDEKLLCHKVYVTDSVNGILCTLTRDGAVTATLKKDPAFQMSNFINNIHSRMCRHAVSACFYTLTTVDLRKFKEIHGKLFDTWDKYEDDEITTTQLLKRCRHIAGLGPHSTHDPFHDV